MRNLTIFSVFSRFLNFIYRFFVENCSLTGYLLWDKPNKKRVLFNEEQFFLEINRVLLLINENTKLEQHKFHKGLCIKPKNLINLTKNSDKSSFSQQISSYFAEFSIFIIYFFELMDFSAKIDEILKTVTIKLEGELVLISPNTENLTVTANFR